jgi:hypothetical protein
MRPAHNLPQFATKPQLTFGVRVSANSLECPVKNVLEMLVSCEKR